MPRDRAVLGSLQSTGDTQSVGAEPECPLQFRSDCITATRGYDFWEGQLAIADEVIE
jgi:hypothetical protein